MSHTLRSASLGTLSLLVSLDILEPGSCVFVEFVFKLLDGILRLKFGVLLGLGDDGHEVLEHILVKESILIEFEGIVEALDTLVVDLELGDAVGKVSLLVDGGALGEALDQLLQEHFILAFLLDETEEEHHDFSEDLLLEAKLTQLTHDVRKKIVDGTIGSLAQLVEQETSHVTDARLLVLETECNLTNLSLDLYHVIEDQVSQDHERVTADTG
mmetsp:Transcript_17915/g.38658  ORF Transcript_17915/g.38658 Transcript_17915/m.38658 type:complete len:214 (-) Transcript_17915:2653-3294(-)